MNPSIFIRSPAEGHLNCFQLWQLWIKMLWIPMRRFLCGRKFLAPLGKYQGAWMLDDAYCVQEAGGFHSSCRAREREGNLEKVKQMPQSSLFFRRINDLSWINQWSFSLDCCNSLIDFQSSEKCHTDSFCQHLLSLLKLNSGFFFWKSLSTIPEVLLS